MNCYFCNKKAFNLSLEKTNVSLSLIQKKRIDNYNLMLWIEKYFLFGAMKLQLSLDKVHVTKHFKRFDFLFIFLLRI